MDGYFINPEGNLGHPVAYTLYLTHKHTYINHIHKGRTCSQGVGCLQIQDRSDPIVQCALIVTVLMSTRRVVQRVNVRVWVVQIELGELNDEGVR